jgi:hypothetical protein
MGVLLLHTLTTIWCCQCLILASLIGTWWYLFVLIAVLWSMMLESFHMFIFHLCHWWSAQISSYFFFLFKQLFSYCEFEEFLMYFRYWSFIRYMFSKYFPFWAGCQWLMPVILAIQEGRDQKDHSSKPAWQIVCETLSRKNLHRKGLVKWLKV